MHLDTPCIISRPIVRWQMLPPSGLQNVRVSHYMYIDAIYFVLNILCVDILSVKFHILCLFIKDNKSVFN